MPSTADFATFARELAEAGGEVIRNYFRSGVAVDSKSDESPVTIADREAEKAIRLLINKRFADHGILGEELGEENPDAEYQWILDPIDGTVSFIHGTFSFGTLIALTRNSDPILGLYHHPILNETLVGDCDTTLYYHRNKKEEVRLRPCHKLEEASLLTTDLAHIKRHQNQEKFLQLSEQVKYLRMWGDCYGYYLLATGYADIMVDPILKTWDVMALVPIIQGAHGMITDYQGGPADKGSSAIAAHPEIHARVVAALN